MLSLKKMHHRRRDNSGIILIIVLWVLVILTLLAVSMGRHTSMELSLTKHVIGKVKSKYLAWAGLIFTIDQVQKDINSEDSKDLDTLYFCGTDMSNPVSVEELFQEHKLQDGYFSVSYPSSLTMDDASPATFYGPQDEERLLNINAITNQNVNIASELFQLLGVGEEDAQIIAYSIIDWKDSNDLRSDESYGAEDGYYESSGYQTKNLAFDSKEELMLVRGVTKEIFKQVKDFITIFPKTGTLRINFDTAHEVVLRALARSFAGSTTNTEIEDAESMVQKLIEYRKGEDLEVFTADDRTIEQRALSLNAKEAALFRSIVRYRTLKSDYLRIRSKGVHTQLNVETEIEAVVSRDDLSIVYWNRN